MVNLNNVEIITGLSKDTGSYWAKVIGDSCSIIFSTENHNYRGGAQEKAENWLAEQRTAAGNERFDHEGVADAEAVGRLLHGDGLPQDCACRGVAATASTGGLSKMDKIKSIFIFEGKTHHEYKGMSLKVNAVSLPEAKKRLDELLAIENAHLNFNLIKVKDKS